MAPTRRTLPAGRSASSSASSTSANGECELTPAALRQWVADRGMAAYRAGQVLRWVYQRGAAGFGEMTDLPLELRSGLAAEFCIYRMASPVVVRAGDRTRKLLFRLEDGAAIESVLIPDPPRLTLCISSQAGCGMGCRFCATGHMGLRRHLGVNEIVGQVTAARSELDANERVTNVVFMGMGEPLHNYAAVVAAIEILTSSWGCGFSTRRVTVSTVGLLPQLERLVAETSVNIAVSLTATTDRVRDRLMPVNRRYPLERLMEVCRSLPIPQRRRITFEYVMLAGVNDTTEDARRLVSLLRGIRAKVNLIPFNSFPGAGFEPSAEEVVRHFQDHLLRSGVNATVRAGRGREIQAACGQLAAAAA